jgi:hypothetical protein
MINRSCTLPMIRCAKTSNVEIANTECVFITECVNEKLPKRRKGQPEDVWIVPRNDVTLRMRWRESHQMMWPESCGLPADREVTSSSHSPDRGDRRTVRATLQTQGLSSQHSAIDPHRTGSAEVRRVCLCPPDTLHRAYRCVHEQTIDGSPSIQWVRDAGWDAAKDRAVGSEREQKTH